ncbi:hypothetical protein LR48_Vigan34s002000 [Vigna angularis]|uniref:Uncharacterized protein n=1 Tax=Phaseolus angularis TaxID=3914 RepID=A0A0L9T3S4_PHAAN|nr:hypothetical protein LR48_Vigan34s002000 [Vigna angularis]
MWLLLMLAWSILIFRDTHLHVEESSSCVGNIQAIRLLNLELWCTQQIKKHAGSGIQGAAPIQLGSSMKKRSSLAPRRGESSAAHKAKRPSHGPARRPVELDGKGSVEPAANLTICIEVSFIPAHKGVSRENEHPAKCGATVMEGSEALVQKFVPVVCTVKCWKLENGDGRSTFNHTKIEKRGTGYIGRLGALSYGDLRLDGWQRTQIGESGSSSRPRRRTEIEKEVVTR